MSSPRKNSKRPLRVLANMRLYTVAGIAQYVSGLIQHNEVSKSLDIYGIDILRPDEPHLSLPHSIRHTHFKLLRDVVDYPPLGTVNQLSQGDITVLRKSFEGIISAYAKAIRRVKPDIILVNGTYFLPWCLLQAALDYGKASVCVHYHGVLTKEVAHWPNDVDRTLMLKMERGFDREDIFYIFPSKLCKRIVEREVFGHPITRSAILPNPVAPEFFKNAPRKSGNGGIGVVSRWSKIKNIDFVVSVAKRNARSPRPMDINIVSDLQSPADTRPFSGLMRFKKPMDNAKLARFYGRQGVIVSPSMFETYGNVAQEALATGTPALVSAQMGVSETFRKLGLSDWIVDFNSPARTLKKAKTVSMSRVPRAAIETLRTEYSTEKIFTQYAKILADAR